MSEANSNIGELAGILNDQADELTAVKNEFDDFEMQVQAIEQNMTQTNSKIGDLEEHDQELRWVFK